MAVDVDTFLVPIYTPIDALSQTGITLPIISMGLWKQSSRLRVIRGPSRSQGHGTMHL